MSYLVLSRREGERILVGPNIVILVSYIGEAQVRLGIEAPEHVRILRSEIQSVYDRAVAALERAQVDDCNMATGETRL